MNQKELNIIRATAQGFAQALDALRSDQGDALLSAALCDLQEPYAKSLRSVDVGYYAAMLLAWQQRGSPDLFT